MVCQMMGQILLLFLGDPIPFLFWAHERSVCFHLTEISHNHVTNSHQEIVSNIDICHFQAHILNSWCNSFQVCSSPMTGK